MLKNRLKEVSRLGEQEDKGQASGRANSESPKPRGR